MLEIEEGYFWRYLTILMRHICAKSRIYGVKKQQTRIMEEAVDTFGASRRLAGSIGNLIVLNEAYSTYVNNDQRLRTERRRVEI